MGKKIDNYKKDFKDRNFILSKMPGLFSFLLFFVIVWILVIVVVAIGASNSSKKKIDGKDTQEKEEQEDDKKGNKSCNQVKKEIGDKLLELGFSQVRDFQPDYYEKDNVSAIISSYDYWFNIKNANVKNAYSLISNFYEIGEDLFTKAVNNLMSSVKKRNIYGSLYIIKDSSKTLFSYDREGTLKIDINYCNTYEQNDKYYYDFYIDKNNLEFDKDILKTVYNYDLKYTDFVNYFINEVKLTGQPGWLKDRNLDIYSSTTNISYEFLDNNSERITYNITHNIEDYKEKIKTDLTYIDKYFNENSMKHYDSIIEKIENRDYLSGDKKTGSTQTGNYYSKNYSLDNNTRLTLNVYEDKIGFYIGFRE